MRGKDEQQLDVFSYVSPEQRVPQDHPLRPLRVMTDEALRGLQARFDKLYAKSGRPSIAPEKLLRALLLQALYSVRSERLLMEQLDYNLLFRWFVGMFLSAVLPFSPLIRGSAAGPGIDSGQKISSLFLRTILLLPSNLKDQAALSRVRWFLLNWSRQRSPTSL